jgi:hypothetical protein
VRTFVFSDFAAGRHTPSQPFSHYDVTAEALLALVSEAFPFAKPGYRDGVMLAPVPPDGFYSGTVEVDEETPLVATFAPRVKGEAPVITVTAKGPKLPAQAVDVVLYRADVLAETNSGSGPGALRFSTDDGAADEVWEVISINARPTPEPEPMNPVAMARNFLELAGGTKATYTAEEFARAVLYWATHANRGGA